MHDRVPVRVAPADCAATSAGAAMPAPRRNRNRRL